MPRAARQLSKTGIYHAIMRGINQQRIFEDTDDFNYFYELLKDIVAESDLSLLAYVLMNNHAHFLLREGDFTITDLFRRLGTRYAYYFNKKYMRSGHLFQDRFKSEPVEDDTYFITVIAYILQNPVRAGACESPEQYRWSSLHSLSRSGSIVDREVLFSLISEPELYQLLNVDSDIDPFRPKARGRKRRFEDEEAADVLCSLSGTDSIAMFQRLSHEQQRNAVAELLARQMSIRQIARTSGLSKGLVEKWSGELSKT